MEDKKNNNSLTIGQLAKAANVGVETIRYYQSRLLIPVNEFKCGTYRRYPFELVARIRFIKCVQELGFSLEQITELLGINDSPKVRELQCHTNAYLATIQSKIANLHLIESTLLTLQSDSAQIRPDPLIRAFMLT